MHTHVIELEKTLANCDDYLALVANKNLSLMHLKDKMVNVNWNEFDNFVCADNAQSEHLINFFYRKGLIDGINSPATFNGGQLF